MKGPNLEADDYTTAYNIISNSTINLDDIQLSSPRKSPEEECIGKDLFHKLSTEAREILDILFNMPAEFVSAINMGSKSGFYEYGLFKFFRDKFTKRKSEQAMKELHEYLKEIYF